MFERDVLEERKRKWATPLFFFVSKGTKLEMRYDTAIQIFVFRNSLRLFFGFPE
jgi:hypothetical protein